MHEDYGCYMCGAMNGDRIYDDEVGTFKCDECGHHSIINFRIALDLLMDMNRTGNLSPEDMEEYNEWMNE